MAIVKACGRVSRLDGDVSPEMISADESDDEEEVSDSADSGNDSDPSDADSGMGSDEFDLSELGEPSTEFCQVGNKSFSVPMELYDLPDLISVLSLETWNEYLTEEERFGLSEFLPAMDEETLALTLSELFSGKNFHFGSPIRDLFGRLKGGMLDPRVVLYRRGLSVFQKREHYHLLRKYQNSMVGGLVRIRDAWKKCKGYGIEERLQLLNILRSQRSLVYDTNGDVGSETDSENSEGGLSDRRTKMGRRGLEPMRSGKDSAKGILKVTPAKVSAKVGHMGVPNKHGKKGKVSKGLFSYAKQKQLEGYDMGSSRKAWNQMRHGNDEDEEDEDDADIYEERRQAFGKRESLLKSGKEEILQQSVRGMEGRFGDVENKAHVLVPPHINKSRIASQGVTVASYNPHSLETMSNAKYPAKNWYPVKNRGQHQVQLGVGEQPYHHGKMHEEVNSSGGQAEEWIVKSKKRKSEDDYKSAKGRIGFDPALRSYGTSPAQIGDSYAKTVQGKSKGKFFYSGGIGTEYSRGDETESDSSDKFEGNEETGYPTATRGHQPGGVRAMNNSKRTGKIASIVNNAHSNRYSAEVGPYSSKGKHKVKTTDSNYMEDIILVKKNQGTHHSGKLHQPWQKSSTAEKRRKGTVDMDHSSPPN